MIPSVLSGSSGSPISFWPGGKGHVEFSGGDAAVAGDFCWGPRPGEDPHEGKPQCQPQLVRSGPSGCSTPPGLQVRPPGGRGRTTVPPGIDVSRGNLGAASPLGSPARKGRWKLSSCCSRTRESTPISPVSSIRPALQCLSARSRRGGCPAAEGFQGRSKPVKPDV